MLPKGQGGGAVWGDLDRTEQMDTPISLTPGATLLPRVMPMTQKPYCGHYRARNWEGRVP